TSTSVNENRPINTIVGTFSTTDPDNPGAGQTHTYSLVSGAGSTNNGSFNISGNQLRTSAVFDYQAQNSYSIRVRSRDNGRPTMNRNKIFTITVNDMLPVITIAKTSKLNSLTDNVFGNLNGQGTCVD